MEAKGQRGGFVIPHSGSEPPHLKNEGFGVDVLGGPFRFLAFFSSRHLKDHGHFFLMTAQYSLNMRSPIDGHSVVSSVLHLQTTVYAWYIYFYGVECTFL